MKQPCVASQTLSCGNRTESTSNTTTNNHSAHPLNNHKNDLAFSHGAGSAWQRLHQGHDAECADNVSPNWVEFCHTLKFLDFRMWLKLKIKQQFSHFRKHFIYREFSKNKLKKLVVFLNLNEVVCLHSCRFALFYCLWFELNLNSWSLNSNQICWIFLQKEKK